MSRPLIVITNDDGITAAGIHHLIQIVRKITNRIVVVAPDSPRSGMSHAITINTMLRIQKVELDGVEAYSCSGTPVDCVKLATARIVKEKPDLIVSGINHGSNSSINVIYSGTIAAAIEGSIQGINSIGFSLTDNSLDSNFEHCHSYIEKIIRHTLNQTFQKACCLNVNIPKVSSDSIKGIRVCRQANAVWKETFDERKDPFGSSYFWLTGKFINYEEENEETDEWALANNFISVVPVHYDITDYKQLAQLKNIEL